MSGKVTRLFNDFKPSKYTLLISVNPKQLQFKGTVTIKGKKTGRPSQRLTFHQSDLKFSSASITKHDKKGDHEIEISRINTHGKSQEVRLHSEQMIYGGEYTVIMEFYGDITKPMNGIYPCYPDKSSEEDIIIATQFESHHAREAFPCIDEPEAKAIFDLTILSPEGQEVISNTKIKKQTKLDGQLKTEFFDTPVMSTYLLAFIVGKLEHKSLKTKDGVEVRTYATKNNIEHTIFALETAVKCLDYYNDFFGIPYPLEKSDLIALPDFAAGAMENWGCITFREHGLLVDSENTSIFTKQYVAIVVAHELAHQWFGNLVTMKWWNDLWLNEGFASWIEHLAVNHIFPEWHIWTQFTVDETMPALKLDALDNTHPIEAVIKHPDEIRTIFDLISYNKGASIIHMLNKYLGDDNFRDGLRLYLKKHEYKNTVTDDLWNALEEVSKKPVKEFMNAWTSKPGFPLVSAEISEDKIKLNQKRFFLHPKAEDKNKTVWPIPLLDGTDTHTIFDKHEMTFDNTNSSFIKLNNGQTGFYRVAYDKKHLIKLADLISSGEILPLDRLGILSDTFETVKSGAHNANTLLDLLMSFSKESNAAVWDIIADILGTIKKVMDNDDIRNNMKPFVKKITKEELSRLSWDEKDDEDYLDQILRPTILGLSASADDKDTIDEINKRFSSAKKSEDIHPNIRSIIYGTIARKGSSKEYDKLLKFYKASESSEDRVVIAMALCSFENEEQINKSLSMINSDQVRLQDVGHWIAYSFSNRFAKRQTWEWMKDNWEWLETNLGKDMSFNRLPVYAANSTTSKEFLEEFRAYFNKVSSPSLDRSIKQGIEILEWHIDWQTRDLKSLVEYFRKLKT